VTATLAVARYTLIDLSRRRILLVFFWLGSLGIVATAIALKIAAAITATGENAAGGSSLELQFAGFISGVLGDFGLLIAYGIGMTAIYHDLDSGAAVSILAKPVSRLAFSMGKSLAAAMGLVVIIGVLAVETRLVILLFGGGNEDTIDGQILAVVANTIVVVLIVLALSTWVNNIMAALIAFIYYNVLASSVVLTLRALVVSGDIDNAIARTVINVVYWFFPHPLTSDIPAALQRAGAGGGGVAGPGGLRGPLGGGLLTSASGPGDIAWWAFTVMFFGAMVYYSIRRRQI
jgi:ABC-type transport system involved in multi-copper enzyme maturation permease subunit